MTSRIGVCALAAMLLWGCSGEENAEDAPVQPVPVESAVKVEPIADPELGEPETPKIKPQPNEILVQKAPAKPARTPDPELPIDLKSQRVLDDKSEENLPEILALLEHKNPKVRRKAIWWIHRLDSLPEATIKPLAARLYDRNSEVAESAAEVLENFDDVSGIAQELHQALDHEDGDVLYNVACLCRKLPAEKRPPLPKLLRLLDVEEGLAPGPAMELIGMMGPQGKPATPFIVKAIEDDRYNRFFSKFYTMTGYYTSLKDEAARTLGRIGATEELLKLSKSDGYRKKILAVHGLVLVRPMTDPVLARIFFLAEYADIYGREEIIEALGDIQPFPKGASNIIQNRLTDKDENIRAAAVKALGKAKPRPDFAFPAILRALRDPDDEVRGAATASLANFQDQPELRFKALLVAAGDEDYSVSNNAIETLNKEMEQSFPIILEALKDPKELPEVRLGAIDALRDSDYEIPEESQQIKINAYVRLLDDPKESIDLRCLAAIGLHWIDESHPHQEDVLIAGLESGSTADIRESAASSLERHPTDKTVTALTKALSDREGEVGEYAAGSLGNIGGAAKAAIPNLITIAKRKEDKLSDNAARALGYISTETTHAKTIPVLMELANHQESDIRIASLKALHGLVYRADDAKKVPYADELVKLMIRRLSDANDYVREEAADALRQFAPEAVSAIPTLVRAVSDNYPGVRYESIETLKRFGGAARPAQEALLDVLNNPEDQYMHDDVIGTLGAIKGDPKKIVPILKKAMKDEDLQSEAIRALGNYAEHAESAVPELRSMLTHPDDWHRLTSANALGKIGAKANAAVPRLTEMLKNDGVDYVRNAAAKALLQIAPESQAAVEIFEATLRGNVDNEWMEEFREERKDKFVTLLKSSLDSQDGEIRGGAIRELRQLSEIEGREDTFLKALKDADENVRLQAALALHETGGHHKALAPVLVESLGSVDDDQRWEVRRVMREAGRWAVPELAAKAADSKQKESVRKTALELLRNMQTNARWAVPELRKIVSEEKGELRYRAAMTWQNVSANPNEVEKEVVPVLLEAIKSSDLDLDFRSEVASNFRYARAADEGLTDELFAIVINPKEDKNLRQTLAYSVGQQTLDDAKIAQVIKMLDKTQSRDLAIVILGQQRSLPETTVPALIAVLPLVDRVDYHLEYAFQRTKQPALNALLAIVEDDSASATGRERALHVLKQFREDSQKSQIIPKVLPLLKSDRYKATAARTLAQLQYSSDDVVEILMETLIDRDNEYRYEAQSALQSLRSEDGKPSEMVVSKLMAQMSKASDEREQEQLLDTLFSAGRDSEKAARAVMQRLSDPALADQRERYHYSLASMGSPAGKVIAETLAAEPTPEMMEFCLSVLAQDWQKHLGCIPEIRKRLSHENPEIAFQAARALAVQANDDAAAVPILLEALNSDDDEKRDVALESLRSIGPEAAPAIPRLIELLDDADTADSALYTLSSIGELPREAIPQIVDAFKNPQTRYYASEVLGEFGTDAQQAIPTLIEMLKSGENIPFVLETLRDINAPTDQVFPVLTELLKEKVVRAEVLGVLGYLQATPEETLPHVLPWIDDPDPLTRQAAIKQVGWIGEVPEDVLAKIFARVDDDVPNVRAAAIFAIGKLAMEPAKSIPLLQAQLKDESLEAKRAAITALGDFGADGAPAVDDLRTLFKEHKGRFDYVVIEALGNIGAPAKAAIPDLIAFVEAAKEKYNYLKENAEIAVWKIDPEAAKAAKLPPPSAANAERPRERVD